MAVTSEDISVVLSGGTVNINPNLSLGGEPSSSPVVDGSLNNLFSDVSATQSEDGHEDYRCIYVFNDGDANVFDIDVYIADDYDDGAAIEIGVRQQNETQRIAISNGPVTSGSMELSYAGRSFISNYNPILSVWAGHMQESLRNLTDSTTGNKLLEDVEVTAQFSGSGSSVTIFDILFVGNDGYTNVPIINVESTNFTPTVTVDVSIPFEGYPINTIATEIEVETTPPGNVSFSAASAASPISLPKLLPEDGFPLWVKRIVPAGTSPKSNDGFKLRFSAKTL